MHIREFAQRVGLSVDTIRFYEKRGLLQPVRQKTNRYRQYGDREIEIVRQIQIGRALGFTLAEIKRGAEAWHSGRLTPAMEISMLTAKLLEVERKTAELSIIAHYLRRKIAWNRGGRKSAPPVWSPVE